MNTIKTLLFSLLITLAAGCRDSRFLDAIPDRALIIPKTLDDFQAILDNDRFMNGAGTGVQGVLPTLGASAVEEFDIPEDLYGRSADFFRQLYTWQVEMPTFGNDLYDWTFPYRAIYYANTVLDGLNDYRANTSEIDQWNRLKGRALFFRSFMYFHLAEIFAPVYDPSTASQAMGLPLRLKSDLNESLSRASLQATYECVLGDLEQALPLLPNLPDGNNARPSKTALYALRARIFLSMREYDRALEAADAALALQATIMDYKNHRPTSTYTFSRGNPEIIFNAYLLGSNDPTIKTLVGYGTSLMRSTLLEQYAPGDLRRSAFFTASVPHYFRGSYTGSGNLFGGLATDELWLIRTECLARANRIQEAMEALNRLLATRYEEDSFTPLAAANQGEALDVILLERRKQLVMRGRRWSDLRRLNLEAGREETLTRHIVGTTYTLPPNDPRYVFPIPDNVIALNPSIIQNNRK